MKKIYCDNCGKEIDRSNELPIYVRLKPEVFGAGMSIMLEKEFPNKTANFDICPLCVINALEDRFGYLREKQHE